MNKKLLLFNALLVITLLLSACGSGGETPTAVPAVPTDVAATAAPDTTAPTATTRGGTLTIGTSSGPATLDPSTGDATAEYYIGLAYDSLILFDYDGEYKPLLATSWKWEGSDFKTFDIGLRPNVKFSDGSDFDANVVKGWLDLQIQNKSVVHANLGTESVEVTSPLSVRLHLATSNPLVPLFLSRTWLSGVIPCASAIADPTTIQAATCGTGPYMLDTENTVTGSEYTFIPNPYYWNPSAIHWDKVVLKVIGSSQAGLDALRAGQIQALLPADAGILSTAVEAGMKTTGVPQNVQGLVLMDKTGTIVPALKEVKVRQALNYAIDRQALSQALLNGTGVPTSNQFMEGCDCFDPNAGEYYTYDVAKAKQLLTEAGYPNGFDVTVLSVGIVGLDTLAQAVASYWQEIGVNVTLDNKTTIADFFGALLSAQYPITVAALGATNPMLLGWAAGIAPGSYWNPDKTEYPELTELMDQLRVTDPSQAAPIAQQIADYVNKNAWFVPVVAGKLNFLYDPTKVSMPDPTGVQPVIYILDIIPAQ